MLTSDCQIMACDATTAMIKIDSKYFMVEPPSLIQSDADGSGGKPCDSVRYFTHLKTEDRGLRSRPNERAMAPERQRPRKRRAAQSAVIAKYREEQARRLDSLDSTLLRDSGRFSLVDITPIAREAQASNLQACGGCDMHLAQRIGAELAITGTVQKVSNLILNMNIYVRDVSSGATTAAMSADMRGNTDETWSRPLDWLVRNRLLAPGYGLKQR